MFVYQKGYLATRKAKQGKKNVGVNQVNTYYDIKKYKRCLLKKGCYKEGSKSKTYSVIIKSDVHKEQLTFNETDYFKEKMEN